MGDVLKTISLDDNPETAKLVESARAGENPVFLTVNRKPVAILVPLNNGAVEPELSEEDYAAFLSAAGGWTDEDADRVLGWIEERRRGSAAPARVDA